MPDFNNNRISMPRMWYDKSVCKPFDISFQRRILLESIHIFMGTAVNLWYFKQIYFQVLK